MQPNPTGVYTRLLQTLGQRGDSGEHVLENLGLCTKTSDEAIAKIKRIQELVLNPDAIVLFYTASEAKKIDTIAPDGSTVVQKFMVENMAIDTYGIRSRRGVFHLKNGAYPIRHHSLYTWLGLLMGSYLYFH